MAHAGNMFRARTKLTSRFHVYTFFIRGTIFALKYLYKFLYHTIGLQDTEIYFVIFERHHLRSEISDSQRLENTICQFAKRSRFLIFAAILPRLLL